MTLRLQRASGLWRGLEVAGVAWKDLIFDYTEGAPQADAYRCLAVYSATNCYGEICHTGRPS